MFFMLRSAVCIGLVVSALPSTGSGMPDLARSAAAATPGVLARFCQANPERCLEAARSAMEVPHAAPMPLRQLRGAPAPTSAAKA